MSKSQEPIDPRGRISKARGGEQPKDTKSLPPAWLMEKLAKIEHDRWSEWQEWCHRILRLHAPSPELEVVLARWDKQIETPYSALSEQEKQSDRDQVMRYWPLIESLIASYETTHAMYLGDIAWACGVLDGLGYPKEGKS